MRDYSELFIHEADRAALAALKKIPGFDLLLRKYLEIYNENVLRIENLSSNLRISEKQMPKYHNMLVDVCKKLHIEKPDFYLCLNPNLEAYTVGETKPTIVISSGLLETFPDELIPTVLAHECGHIVCHHTFYNTLALYLINGVLNEVSKLFGVGSIAADAIGAAFSYWKRCSEISADRLAIIYDGSPDKMIECCMRFSGYDKNINDTFSVEEYLEQAKEYKKLIKESTWNKFLEATRYLYASHPLHSIRALECMEWSKKDDFDKIMALYKTDMPEDIPMVFNSAHYVGLNYEDVKNQFEDMGFKTITVNRVTECTKRIKELGVADILIDGKSFEKYNWVKNNANVNIEFYQSKTEEELKAEHPGQNRFPNSIQRYIGKNVQDVMNELARAGFTIVISEPVFNEKRTIFSKDESVLKVIVEGMENIQKDDWVDKNQEIKIYYNKYL